MNLELFINSRKTIVVLIVIFALCGWGCEKATSTWGNTVIDNPQSASIGISGTIISALPIAAGMRNAQAYGSVIASAEVYIEALPHIKTISDDQGKFVLENVPAGTHNVIAKFRDLAHRFYKQRSRPVSIADKPEEIGELMVSEAKSVISGILRNTQQQPIAYATLLLWGEAFQTNADGFFTTPPLPTEAATATIFIPQTQIYKSCSFPAHFIDHFTQNLELTLSAGNSNSSPPILQVITGTNKLSPNEQLALTALVYDYDQQNIDTIPITWSVKNGQLQVSGNRRSAIYTAPDDNIAATVTAVVTDATGLSATATISITVGAGGIGNQRPELNNIRIASSSENIKIIFDLVDRENDRVNTKVFYSLDSGKSFTQTLNIDGDVNQAAPGNNRSIIWKPGLDLRQVAPQVIIRLLPADRLGDGPAIQSDIFALAPANVVPQNSPGNVMAVGSDTFNTLTWSEVAGAKHYNLYWQTAADITINNGAVINSVTSPFEHAGLINGSTYYYMVTAVNSWGESPAPLIVQARPLPVLPTRLTLEPANGSFGNSTMPTFKITFNAPIAVDGGKVAIYKDNGILHELITLTTSNIEGATLSFSSTIALADDAFYHVTIADGVLKDIYARDLAGLTAGNDWHFKTMLAYNETIPWNLVTINATAAWAYSTGEGVTVAVIDTGIEPTHPEFVGQLKDGGADFFNDGYFLQDGLGHGTHVAGIIAARGNNFGIIGVAPRAKIYVSKVFSRTGTGPSAATIVSAVEDAVNNGARIINMSIGSKIFNASYEDVAAWARTRGAVIFAAAGNDGSSQLRYLAACPSAIAVSATGPNDAHWPYANFAPQVAFSAPGDNILSAILGAGYGQQSGTSMASPHIAAVAALILAKNPEYSIEQMLAALIYGSVDLGNPGRDLYFGYGRIDALKALQFQPTLPMIRAGSREYPQSAISLKSDFMAQDFIAGQLLIRLVDGKALKDILKKADLDDLEIKVIKKLPMPNAFLIKIPESREKELGRKLQLFPEVIYAELNAIISLN